MRVTNTKAVGYAGIATFLIGLLTYGPFQSALLKLVGPIAADWISLGFLVAGFAASYFGMPFSVSSPSANPTPAAPEPQKAPDPQ